MDKLNQHSEFEDLIIRFLDGYASQEETDKLMEWSNSSSENQLFFDDMKSLWDSTNDVGLVQKIDINADLAAVKKRASEAKVVRIEPKRKKNKFWYGIAAGIALLVASFMIFQLLQDDQSLYSEFTLADGTVVKLKNNSRLTSPDTFEGDTRVVQLEGEAFFDVHHNPEQPFIIQTAQAEVKALGTSFAVNTKSSNTEVILYTGIVELSSVKDPSQKVLLNRLDDLGIASNLEVSKSINQDPNAISWATGKFQFQELSLPQVAEILTSHFQQKIVLEDKFMGCMPKANFDQDNLDHILGVITHSCGLTLEKKGKSFYIKG